MQPIYTQLYNAGLVRDTSNKMIGGVCSGLARKLGADVNAVRLLTVVLIFVLPGSPLLVYVLAWLLMPDQTYRPGVEAGSTTPPATGWNGPQDEVPPRS